MERPNRARALVLGCIGSCCILTSWYYGLFATIGSLGFVLLVRHSSIMVARLACHLEEHWCCGADLSCAYLRSVTDLP